MGPALDLALRDPTNPEPLCMRLAAGRQIPRVELAEMGPALDLALRRHRTPAPDLEKEALKQAKLGKKKVLARSCVFPCASY